MAPQVREHAFERHAEEISGATNEDCPDNCAKRIEGKEPGLRYACHAYGDRR